MACDQTAPRAERMALWYATAAAAAAGIDVALLIDSQATVRRLTRAISHSPTGDAEAFWHAFLDRWRLGSLVAWVPSHGKDSAWAPPAHFPNAATCRHANSLADAEVTRLLDSLAPAVQSTAADAAAATTWVKQCHQAQHDATAHFYELCQSVWRTDRWRNM